MLGIEGWKDWYPAEGFSKFLRFSVFSGKRKKKIWKMSKRQKKKLKYLHCENLLLCRISCALGCLARCLAVYLARVDVVFWCLTEGAFLTPAKETDACNLRFWRPQGSFCILRGHKEIKGLLLWWNTWFWGREENT